MNKTKQWSLVALTTVVLALTACSGNPVDEKGVVKKTTTASAKKPVKKVTRNVTKKIAPARTKVAARQPKKVVVVKRPPATVKKRFVARKAVTVARNNNTRAKTLTRAQSRAKKQSIAALSKSKQAQARLNYTRTQNRKNYINNQRLKSNRLRNVQQARHANYSDASALGLGRFAGSQVDVVVERRSPRPAKVATTKRYVGKSWPVKVAAVNTRSRQPVQVRAKQPVLTRAIQPVRPRAKQPVRTRARQPVLTRAIQPVRPRAKQPVRTRARQPVRSRAQQQAQARVRQQKQQQQQIRTKAQQRWVRAKAQEEQIRTKAQQKWVRTRAQQQQIRSRSQQPVRSRGTQYAARTNNQVRRDTRYNQPKQNFRRVSLAKRPNVNRARSNVRPAVYRKPVKRSIPRIEPNTSFGFALSKAAVERTRQRVRYDGKYLKIGYPWGDVPKSIGVCTDVVIRAYRRLGIDLQQEVHKDITKDFYAYPNLVKWGLRKADPNIDHRRVYNLQAFFRRHKAELPRSRNPRDYKAGDLVTWMVGPNFPHIGIVVDKPSKSDPNRLMIAHNIGYGPKVEDILFRFPMTGHYRYNYRNKKINPSLLFAKTPAPASVLRKQRNNRMSAAEMLQASKILSGEFKARSFNNLNDLLVKNNQAAKPQQPIMLAGLDQDALKVLLK